MQDKDWDEHLPFVYRVSAQESPFYLLYGRDARIPTETVLSHSRSPYAVDVVEYKEELACKMSLAWKIAHESIEKAQRIQKKAYDKRAREVDLRVGEHVMVFMPSESQGKNWKLTRPLQGCSSYSYQC